LEVQILCFTSSLLQHVVTSEGYMVNRMRPIMRVILIIAAVAGLALADVASAQGLPTSPPAKQKTAPTGHRQPTAKGVSPNTVPADPAYNTPPELDKREVDLKRRLQRICRGC
jgi:hypothetical protein